MDLRHEILIAREDQPLAATKEELEQIAGFWPDIEKSRAEARRLLQEAFNPVRSATT